MDIPGIDLDGSYGAAEFVAWYDGHPDFPRTWPLDAEKVAVIGVGNVALDVARVLAKTGEELLPTEIPPNVYSGLDEQQGDRGARLRTPRTRPGQVHPARAQRARPLPDHRGHRRPRGHRLRRGLRRARRGSKKIDQVATIIRTTPSASPATARTSCSCTSSSPPWRSSAPTARSSGCAPNAPSSTAPATSAAPAS